MILVLPIASMGLTLCAQRNVSGVVRDGVTGELLIGASVTVPGKTQGTATDNNGYFSLRLVDLRDSLIVSYVGYATQTVKFLSARDTILNVSLQPGTMIEDVYIRGYRKTGFNMSTLSRKELIYIPSIGAEPDVLKSLQLLPGIQSQNEGSSNLLVRGGGPGENQFLIDNIPLYYINHLGGFISVFNPEVINDVRVLKGGFPAKYGGKVSSVVDITMREGDHSGFKGSAGIGLIGANLTLEGPISGRTSYLISARKTFTELLLGAASYFGPSDFILTYGFYDLNGKVTFRPDLRNSLQASLYLGDDQWNTWVFDKDDKMTIKNKWGNVLGSFGWKCIPSPKIQFDNTLSFTRYRMKDAWTFQIPEYNGTNYDFHSNYRSSVQNVTFKSDWRTRFASVLTGDFGFHSSFLTFIPNVYWANQESNDEPEVIQALESALYLENRISLGHLLNLNLGFRAVNYLTKDLLHYSIEPRLDISVSLSKTQLFNATYMTTSQYAHLVYSSGQFFNNEVWVPTQKGMQPAGVRQYSAGWKGDFLDRTISAEIDVYWKSLKDLVAFKEGYANLKGDARWESKLEKGGSGHAYGFECFIKKNVGNFTGFLSYEYSRAYRQFDNINLGKKYVFEYDRPHRFSIDIHQAINERLEVNVLWVFQSGLPYTPAIARAYVPCTDETEVSYDYEALIYGERNSKRMRPYHRLDVGLYYKTKTKRNRNSMWTFSIYNLYSRQNPYFYYYNTSPSLNFGSEAHNGFLNLYQLSYFPIIPTISYKIDF